MCVWLYVCVGVGVGVGVGVHRQGMAANCKSDNF